MNFATTHFLSQSIKILFHIVVKNVIPKREYQKSFLLFVLRFFLLRKGKSESINKRNTKSLVFICLAVFVLTVSNFCSADAEVRVVKIEGGTDSYSFGKTIFLELTGLEELKKESNDKGKVIIPFLGGWPLKNVTIVYPNTNSIKFRLLRSNVPPEALKALIAREGFFTSEVSISVGVKDGIQKPTNVHINIDLIDKAWFIIGVIF
jgi:hypothetical protein